MLIEIYYDFSNFFTSKEFRSDVGHKLENFLKLVSFFTHELAQENQTKGRGSYRKHEQIFTAISEA